MSIDLTITTYDADIDEVLHSDMSPGAKVTCLKIIRAEEPMIWPVVLQFAGSNATAHRHFKEIKKSGVIKWRKRAV